tara:strand:+ start:234 stop:494 length:261 start_codon:yes stop_codon:yes gene_type:complete
MKNTKALKSLLDSKVDMTNIKTIKSIETEAQKSPALMMSVSEVIEELSELDDAIAELSTMRSAISDLLDKHLSNSQIDPDTDADES